MPDEVTKTAMKMTKLHVGHIILGVLLSFFLIVPTSVCDNDVIKNQSSLNNKLPVYTNNIPGKPQEISVDIKNVTSNKNITLAENVNIEKNSSVNATNIKNITNNDQQKNTVKSSDNKFYIHSPELDSGAVIRAFYVFVGLSVIVVAYLIFRSFRLRSNPVQMVRKYGVLTHKQDVEMRPLPLDDDDDDDDTTVFDASKLSLHSNQNA